MCHRFIVFIVFFFASVLQAQPDYKVIYPYSQSAEAGASFHILLHREISACRNALLPSSVFQNNCFSSKAGNVAYRLFLMGTVDFYLAYLPVLNQHEYFGHLGRVKQLNAV